MWTARQIKLIRSTHRPTIIIPKAGLVKSKSRISLRCGQCLTRRALGEEVTIEVLFSGQIRAPRGIATSAVLECTNFERPSRFWCAAVHMLCCGDFYTGSFYPRMIGGGAVKNNFGKRCDAAI